MSRVRHPLVRALLRWVSPVVPVGATLRALRRYPTFLGEWLSYRRRCADDPPRWVDGHPCLLDRTPSTGFDPHYLHQARWALQRLHASAPPTHVDVGSDLMFAAMAAVITPVTTVDIRPAPPAIGARPVRASLLELPFASASIPSLSCLHVLEHVGLGRYGDPLDTAGSDRAAAELDRVLAPGGQLLLSLPIGRPRVCFNAHRVHAPGRPLEWFGELELTGFAAVDDDGRFLPRSTPAELDGADYACGFYHFTRG